MARVISLVLTALVAGVIAQSLESCGSAEYDPSQYTCFNNSLLCPIVNGVAYQNCGQDCYSTAEYTCFNGDLLCPYASGGIATQACGDACYDFFEYNCNDGELSPAPSCIGDYGTSEFCDTQGCFLLPCCAGLISIADHCRDPCELDPSFCPNGTNPFL
ncbi:carbohydrate binding-domain-containing protein [Mycena galericulata]|nr:carbohydrate binding-domain-containing protein [Mycena galericulata]